MKKKIFGLMLPIISICFITGCGETNKELDTNISNTIDIDESGAALVCTADYDYNEYDYVIGAKYVFFADKDQKVTQVRSQEIFSSNDQAQLDQIATYYNDIQNRVSQYGGVDSNVTREKTRIISDLTIDYADFNLAQYEEDNPEGGKIDGSLTIDYVEAQYISQGATCTRK